MKKILLFFAMIVGMTISANAQEYEWKWVTGSMTNVPDNFYEGLTKDDVEAAKDEWPEVIVYGNKPAEGGAFSVLVYDFDEGWTESTMTWADIVDNGFGIYPATKGASGPVNLELDENSTEDFDWIINYETTYSKVTLTRSMKRYLADGTTKRWHTVALPFGMNAEQIESNFGSGAKVMKLSGIDGDTFEFVTASSISNDELYLVQLGDLATDVQKIEVTNTKCGYMYGKYDTDYDVVAVTYKHTIDDMLSTCYIIANNQFHEVTSEVTATATKWYVEKKESFSWDDVHELTINLDGVATSISTISTPVNADSASRKAIENGRLVIKKGDKKYSVEGIELQ